MVAGVAGEAVGAGEIAGEAGVVAAGAHRVDEVIVEADLALALASAGILYAVAASGALCAQVLGCPCAGLAGVVAAVAGAVVFVEVTAADAAGCRRLVHAVLAAEATGAVGVSRPHAGLTQGPARQAKPIAAIIVVPRIAGALIVGRIRSSVIGGLACEAFVGVAGASLASMGALFADEDPNGVVASVAGAGVGGERAMGEGIAEACLAVVCIIPSRACLANPVALPAGLGAPIIVAGRAGTGPSQVIVPEIGGLATRARRIRREGTGFATVVAARTQIIDQIIIIGHSLADASRPHQLSFLRNHIAGRTLGRSRP